MQATRSKTALAQDARSRRALAVLLCTFLVAGVPTLAQTPPAPEKPAAQAASRPADRPAASAPSAPVTQAKPEPVGTTLGAPVLSSTGLHELSPWAMFLAADVVVKGVMVGLMIASLLTWTILLGKTVELTLARRRLAKTIDRVHGARTVPEAQVALQQGDFLADLLAAARHEMDLSGPYAPHDGVKARCDSRLADLARVETQGMRRGMGVLATIGSTAPFVGLFGTVWGIMNSFIGISKSQTTNLAVVAPGIAEALLATAIGLVAAIPAVIIYNHFSRSTRSYQLLITRASGVVTRLVSRELDLEPRAMARAAE